MAEKKSTTKAAAKTTKAAAEKKAAPKKAAAKKTEVVINVETVGFKAGDVYQALFAAEKALSVRRTTSSLSLNPLSIIKNAGVARYRHFFYPILSSHTPNDVAK